MRIFVTLTLLVMIHAALAQHASVADDAILQELLQQATDYQPQWHEGYFEARLEGYDGTAEITA